MPTGHILPSGQKVLPNRGREAPFNWSLGAARGLITGWNRQFSPENFLIGFNSWKGATPAKLPFGCSCDSGWLVKRGARRIRASAVKQRARRRLKLSPTPGTTFQVLHQANG